MAHSRRRYEGKRLNSPNDVVVDKRGGIWFSDPTFGVLNKAESYGGKPEQGGEYVYRYDPEQNQLVRLNTPGLHSPNGLRFHPIKACCMSPTRNWRMISRIRNWHTASGCIRCATGR